MASATRVRSKRRSGSSCTWPSIWGVGHLGFDMGRAEFFGYFSGGNFGDQPDDGDEKRAERPDNSERERS